MSQLGISPSVIIRELRQKNLAVDGGRVKVGSEFITVAPTGDVSAVKDFESILLSGNSDRQIFLRDIATVRRGYVERLRTASVTIGVLRLDSVSQLFRVAM